MEGAECVAGEGQVAERPRVRSFGGKYESDTQRDGIGGGAGVRRAGEMGGHTRLYRAPLRSGERNRINCTANSLSVNNPARVNYPENQKARVCKAGEGYDLLHKPGWGEYMLYDPAVHGQWEIGQELKDGKVRWVVRQVGAKPAPPPPPPHPALSNAEEAVVPVAPVDELAHLRRRIMEVLDQVDKRVEFEQVGARIGRLLARQRLPVQVGKAMQWIVSLRNKVEYDKYAPMPTEMTMARALWAVIEEWCGKKTSKRTSTFAAQRTAE